MGPDTARWAQTPGQDGLRFPTEESFERFMGPSCLTPAYRLGPSCLRKGSGRNVWSPLWVVVAHVHKNVQPAVQTDQTSGSSSACSSRDSYKMPELGMARFSFEPGQAFLLLLNGICVLGALKNVSAWVFIPPSSNE